jgi:hypothetical protein
MKSKKPSIRLLLSSLQKQCAARIIAYLCIYCYTRFTEHDTGSPRSRRQLKESDHIPEHRLPFSAALEAADPQALLALLSHDVLIRLAVHDRPIRGKGLARTLIPVFLEDFDEIRVTDEIVENRSAVVVFQAIIDGRPIDGLTLLHQNDAAMVDQVRIFLRPLGAMAVAAEVVMGQIADRLSSPGPRMAMRAAQAAQRIGRRS